MVHAGTQPGAALSLQIRAHQMAHGPQPGILGIRCAGKNQLVGAALMRGPQRMTQHRAVQVQCALLAERRHQARLDVAQSRRARGLGRRMQANTKKVADANRKRSSARCSGE